MLTQPTPTDVPRVTGRYETGMFLDATGTPIPPPPSRPVPVTADSTADRVPRASSSTDIEPAFDVNARYGLSQAQFDFGVERGYPLHPLATERYAPASWEQEQAYIDWCASTGRRPRLSCSWV